jgi:hypothetical protein
MKSIAYLTISGEVLRQLLHMPSDCEIVASVDGEADQVRLLVGHESIPPEALEIVAIYRTIHGVSVFDHFEVVRKHELEAAA